MSIPTKISPQWVAQVLRDRGIRPPAILSIQQFLVALTEQQREEVYGLLRKVEQGVDDPAITRDIVERMEAQIPHSQAGQGAYAKRPQHAPSVPTEATAGSSAKKVAAPGPAPWYRGHGAHIYAASAAMKVELDLLKADQDDLVRYTVQIEAAPSIATRSYDWDNKIAFQFTRRELPVLAAMLMGYLKSPLTLSNHGPDRDKSLEIHDTGTNRLLVRLRQGPRRLLIPVFAEDVHAWLTITMQALKHNAPELDGVVLLEMLKRVAAIHGSPETSAGPGHG